MENKVEPVTCIISTHFDNENTHNFDDFEHDIPEEPFVIANHKEGVDCMGLRLVRSMYEKE